jgi:fructokinase
MPKFVTMGELLVDFISDQRGEIAWVAPVTHDGRTRDRSKGRADTSGEETSPDTPVFIPAPGGAPANVAAGLGLLGKDAGFIGKVGDDPFGKGLVTALSGLGVDTQAVSYSKEARTMLAFVTRTVSGERDFVFFRHPSADMLITPEDIPAGYLSGASFFHFGSIGLIAEPARSTTLSLIGAAREAGAMISCDPNIRFPLFLNDSHARKTVLEVIPQTDILKLSEEEAVFLTGEKTPKAAAIALLSMGPGLVAVTCGNKGSVAVTGRYAVEVDGFEVPVVDTTGAGDAFCAAMLAMVSHTEVKKLPELSDLDLINIFRFANAAGALTVTGRGAIPSLPTEKEVYEFLREKRVSKSSRIFH